MTGAQAGGALRPPPRRTTPPFELWANCARFALLLACPVVIFWSVVRLRVSGGALDWLVLAALLALCACREVVLASRARRLYAHGTCVPCTLVKVERIDVAWRGLLRATTAWRVEVRYQVGGASVTARVPGRYMYHPAAAYQDPDDPTRGWVLVDPAAPTTCLLLPYPSADDLPNVAGWMVALGLVGVLLCPALPYVVKPPRPAAGPRSQEVALSALPPQQARVVEALDKLYQGQESYSLDLKYRGEQRKYAWDIDELLQESQWLTEDHIRVEGYTLEMLTNEPGTRWMAIARPDDPAGPWFAASYIGSPYMAIRSASPIPLREDGELPSGVPLDYIR